MGDHAETDTDAASSQNRINGVVDVPRPARVVGWAIDRADPAAHVTVDLYREGLFVESQPATVYRPDLEKGGIGTGRYGFAFDLAYAVPPGLGFTITAVARTVDGTKGALRRIGAAAPSEEADQRLQQETFQRLADISRDLDETRGQISGRAGTADAEKVTTLLDRIEIAQARIETRLDAVESSQIAAPAGNWRIAVGAALATGLILLGVGIGSLFVG